MAGSCVRGTGLGPFETFRLYSRYRAVDCLVIGPSEEHAMVAAFCRFSRFTLALFAAALCLPAHAETIARCGDGFLEEIDGYRVLQVKGTPYEKGFQHGALLKDHI